MYKLLILITVAILLQPSKGLFNGKSVSEYYIKDGKYTVDRSYKEFPYVVEIELHEMHLCGGTLIRRGVVITAGHCFKSEDTTGLRVKAGHIYRGSNRAPALQQSQVDRFEKHPSFFHKVINGQSEVYFDLALVKLKQPFDLTDFVNLAKLAPYGTEEPFKGQAGFGLGWGTTEDGKLSPELKKVQLNVLSPEQCKTEVGEKDYIKSLLCVKGENNKGAFGGGDSGGPFVKHFPENPKDDILLGVISFSYHKRHPIYRDRFVPIESKPSVTSNIAVFHKWIQKILGIFKKEFQEELKKNGNQSPK